MSDSDDDDDDEEVEACRIGMELMMHTIGSQIDVFEHASLIFHRNAIACCQFSSHWYGKFSYLSSCRRFTFVWNVWCTANVSCSLFVLLLLLSSLSKHTQTHEFTSFSAFLLFCPWAFDIYKCIYSNLKCHSNWACMPLEHILQLLNIIYFYRRDMSEMVEVVVAVEGLGRAYILFNMTFDKWQCRLQNHQRSIHHFCAIQFFFSLVFAFLFIRFVSSIYIHFFRHSHANALGLVLQIMTYQFVPIHCHFATFYWHSFLFILQSRKWKRSKIGWLKFQIGMKWGILMVTFCLYSAWIFFLFHLFLREQR